MTIIHRFFIRLDSLLAFAMRFLCISCMITLLIILASVVFVRFVPLVSLGWSDEIVEWAFAWMVFIGAAALWRDREHFSVNWLQERQAGKPSGKYIELIVELLSLIFITVMTYYGLKLTIAANDWSPILQLPRRLWYTCIPTAGTIMIVYSLRNIFKSVSELRTMSKNRLKGPNRKASKLSLETTDKKRN